jgi:hypothetical protein
MLELSTRFWRWPSTFPSPVRKRRKRFGIFGEIIPDKIAPKLAVMRRIRSRAVNLKGDGKFDNNAPGGRLEYLGDIRAIAGGARGAIFAADAHQNAAQLKQLTSDNWV